jgi:hypothetical protein
MPDREARDAYFEVEVDLPDGQKITGRSVPFRQGLALKILLYKFSETMEQVDFDALWTAFEQATGITEAQLTVRCPSITLLELTDLISRFIYLLRPGRTAAQVPHTTPASTAAMPSAPAPTAGSAVSDPTPPAPPPA